MSEPAHVSDADGRGAAVRDRHYYAFCCGILSMTSIAIIPARGGSKRIPRKNIKDFSGKPIIAYSILAAKSTGLFDVVMVSTDDEEIAAVARSYGAEVPFLRTAKNA